MGNHTSQSNHISHKNVIVANKIKREKESEYKAPQAPQSSLLAAQEKCNKLEKEKHDQRAAHEKSMRTLQASLKSKDEKAIADKSTYFVLGLVCGVIISVFVMWCFRMFSAPEVETCRDMFSAPEVETCRDNVSAAETEAPPIAFSKATGGAHVLDIPADVAQTYQTQHGKVSLDSNGQHLFSFSNIMYMIGALVILLSYGFQMIKTRNSPGERTALSALYCIIFYVAGGALFPLPSNQLVGGCYFVIASLLIGAAALCALEVTERDSLRGPFRPLPLVSSFFHTHSLRPPPRIRSDDMSMLLRLCLKLAGVLASSGGLAAYLYWRTAFPGLLLPVFAGLYGDFVLFALCLYCMSPETSIHFHWVTFVFGLLCASALFNEEWLGDWGSDEVLRLSLQLAALNCCVPTLPVLLAEQMGLATFDEWAPFLRDLQATHTMSAQSLYRLGGCLLYTYMNLTLLAASAWLDTWLHVPYILLSMSFVLGCLLGNVLFALLIGVPLVLVCVSMPSILLSVRDEAVHSVSIPPPLLPVGECLMWCADLSHPSADRYCIGLDTRSFSRLYCCMPYDCSVDSPVWVRF